MQPLKVYFIIFVYPFIKSSIHVYYKAYKLKETHSAYEIDLCKGAINQCTKNIALEYGKDNIRANVVAPGAVMTTFLESILV